MISIQKHTGKTTANQQARQHLSGPNKISGSTHFDFHAQNLTAYGGLLPVAALLENLGFEQLISDTVTLKRATRSLTPYRFLLAMILAIYVGFSRLMRIPTKKISHSELMTITSSPRDAVGNIV